jgi:hypothetical protein
MKLLRLGRLDAIRAGFAGSRAVAVRSAAKALFEAGGKDVLPATVQKAIRGAVESEASRMLMAVGLAERALEGGTAEAARAATVVGARAASRQVLRGITSAAGAGALIDGGWALFQAARRVRAGTMTKRQAAGHVAREAGTGAAATAAGTAAAALLVAVSGGIATPAVFIVAAAASIGAKAGLDAWIGRNRVQGSDGSYARFGDNQRSATANVLPLRRA